MKKLLTLLMLTATLSLSAKDIKTLVVTTLPQMHCDNCEKKIKGNLRFEKGIKSIETDVNGQKVTITYDAEKTTPEKIIQSFQKFGYTATELKTEQKENTTRQ
ncbi:MAG: cation transporter [Prevotella sp.]|nr:cation transporter [Prevotella sp.]